MKINIVSKMLAKEPPRGHVAINDGAEDDPCTFAMIVYGPNGMFKTENEALVALALVKDVFEQLQMVALDKKSPQHNKIVDMAAKHSAEDAEKFFDYIAFQKRIEELEKRAAEIEKSIKPREDQLMTPRWP